MTSKSLLFLVFAFASSFSIYAQSNTEIKVVLREFQEGYSKRDTSLVNRFVDDLCSKDIQILGTGENEFLHGMTADRNLFAGDWAHWFGLQLDTTSIVITSTGNTALFMVQGTAAMSFPNKDIAYDFALGRLQQLVNEEKTSRGKLLAYSGEASDLIRQIESGGLEIKYLIRLTGALVKQNNKWLFTQLNYSFPYPMARE
jgi:hypothetical protein